MSSSNTGKVCHCLDCFVHGSCCEQVTATARRSDLACDGITVMKACQAQLPVEATGRPADLPTLVLLAAPGLRPGISVAAMASEPSWS